jgi:hypothetical protein
MSAASNASFFLGLISTVASSKIILLLICHKRGKSPQ